MYLLCGCVILSYCPSQDIPVPHQTFEVEHIYLITADGSQVGAIGFPLSVDLRLIVGVTLRVVCGDRKPAFLGTNVPSPMIFLARATATAGYLPY